VSTTGQIGQYRLIRKIGEGGMGAVFLGEHLLVGRRAAIKVLQPELSTRRDVVGRSFNVAGALTAISDPGIVQMFDFGFHDGSAYIVMELLEGETLHQRLARVTALWPLEALRITRQVAGSLAAAHTRGIVHRDLKPENVFMVRDPETAGGERAKVLDFGIAKLGHESNRSLTMTGTLLGTPVYMSPEQCRGSGEIDARADIYSLGCVLFHVLAGRPPFDAEGMGELISAHLREPPPPPSAFANALPPELDALVLRCLAKSPDQRFQTMTELQAACDALLVRMSQSGPSAPTVAVVAVPLSAGFRSVTPGREVAVLTPAPAPTTPLLPAGTPTTLGAATGQVAAARTTRRTTLWVVLVAALLTLGGSIAAIVVMQGKRTDAPARAPASSPELAPAPASEAAATPAPAMPAEPPAIAPGHLPPDAGVAVTADAAAAPDVATTVHTPPTPTPSAKRKPKPSSKRPTPASTSDEDLYDGR